MRMSWALALLLLTLLIVMTAGCKSQGGMEIASARLVCRDEPAIPADPVTDEDNGRYLRSMRGAWADCKSKLDWVRDFVKPK